MDVILIPHLGADGSERGYLRLRPLWRLFGISLHVFSMNWEDGEAFAIKYARLKDLVADCPNLIGVVSASAGASAVVALLNDGLVKRAVTVCGAFNNSIINPVAMAKRSPAFLTAINQATQYLAEDSTISSKMLTIRPLIDGVVKPSVETTPGARDKRIWTVGHGTSIVYTLVFKIGLIKKFLGSMI